MTNKGEITSINLDGKIESTRIQPGAIVGRRVDQLGFPDVEELPYLIECPQCHHDGPHTVLDNWRSVELVECGNPDCLHQFEREF